MRNSWCLSRLRRPIVKSLRRFRFLKSIFASFVTFFALAASALAQNDWPTHEFRLRSGETLTYSMVEKYRDDIEIGALNAGEYFDEVEFVLPYLLPREFGDTNLDMSVPGAPIVDGDESYYEIWLRKSHQRRRAGNLQLQRPMRFRRTPKLRKY